MDRRDAVEPQDAAPLVKDATGPVGWDSLFSAEGSADDDDGLGGALDGGATGAGTICGGVAYSEAALCKLYGSAYLPLCHAAPAAKPTAADAAAAADAAGESRAATSDQAPGPRPAAAPSGSVLPQPLAALATAALAATVARAHELPLATPGMPLSRPLPGAPPATRAAAPATAPTTVPATAPAAAPAATPVAAPVTVTDPGELAYRQAMGHFKAARYAEAEQGFRRALELKAELLPPQDPQLAVVLNNLASTMEKLGSPREAQALYREAIVICNASLPPSHPRLKHIQAKLAELELQLFSFPGL